MWRFHNRFQSSFFVIAISGTASMWKGAKRVRKTVPAPLSPSIRTDECGDLRVLVLPITHSPPDHAGLAVEIPAATKRRLQLDDARSWVVLSEWNEFVWPGPDLRRVRGADDASVAYGMLPSGLLAVIRERLIALAQKGGARPVHRT